MSDGCNGIGKVNIPVFTSWLTLTDCALQITACSNTANATLTANAAISSLPCQFFWNYFRLASVHKSGIYLLVKA